ncbi:hypothetical protein D3C76_1684280 [compost metagenome]
MQGNSDKGCNEAEQHGRLTGNDRHFRDQCHGLQDDRQNQQDADQVLQLMARAFVPVRNNWGKRQVEQAEKGQVQRIGLLQVR